MSLVRLYHALLSSLRLLRRYLVFCKTVGTSALFVLSDCSIFLGVHSLDITIDKFSVLGHRQPKVIVNWRHDKFCAKGQLFLKLFQTGMLKCLFDCYSSLRTEFQHSDNQLNKLSITSSKIIF